MYHVIGPGPQLPVQQGVDRCHWYFRRFSPRPFYNSDLTESRYEHRSRLQVSSHDLARIDSSEPNSATQQPFEIVSRGQTHHIHQTRLALVVNDEAEAPLTGVRHPHTPTGLNPLAEVAPQLWYLEALGLWKRT